MFSGVHSYLYSLKHPYKQWKLFRVIPWTNALILHSYNMNNYVGSSLYSTTTYVNPTTSFPTFKKLKIFNLYSNTDGRIGLQMCQFSFCLTFIIDYNTNVFNYRLPKIYLCEQLCSTTTSLHFTIDLKTCKNNFLNFLKVFNTLKYVLMHMLKFQDE